ncbi:MAG: hypothetical protein IJT43_11855 [Stomatobaculum sp.]|nr:hypothetical protein [Stomatobaculum sp.]
MIGSYYDLTDIEIVELMNSIDSDNYSTGLNDRFHSPRWWALESILRERHGNDWSTALSVTA